MKKSLINLLQLFFLFHITLVLYGCSPSGNNVNVPPGSVSLYYPANGTNGVSKFSNIILQFSTTVSNVTSNNVSVHIGSPTGTVIPIGTISQINTSSTTSYYTFSPTSTLLSGTIYYVVIGNGITDINGNSISPINFNFTTVSNGSAWAWFSGSQTPNQIGNYGTIKELNQNNTPSSRQSAMYWADKSGNFWLFGGYGYDSLGNQGFLNDLWKFNLTSHMWVWMGGANTAGQAGVYGTKLTPSIANIPSARSLSCSWTDSNGNLWLFGGATTNLEQLNDLWQYNTTTNMWTWVSGSNTINQQGIYNSPTIANPTNVPGSRDSANCWIDSQNTLWLFGGIGYDANRNYGMLNDLWKYNISTNQWTWMKGSNSSYALGVYNSIGIENTSSVPGSRVNAAQWIDGNGNLWLFGGNGYTTSTGSSALLNDVWRYKPTTNNWTWIGGANNNNGVSPNYGTQGQPSSTNNPGSRDYPLSWVDNVGNLWLFGGYGVNTNGPEYGYFNDLWSYNTTTNMWTWVSGNNTINPIANYGTSGVFSNSYTPNATWGTSVWVDANNNPWIFGGANYQSSGGYFYNNLWSYIP